jgi:hypothetical protein
MPSAYGANIKNIRKAATAAIVQAFSHILAGLPPVPGGFPAGLYKKPYNPPKSPLLDPFSAKK